MQRTGEEDNCGVAQLAERQTHNLEAVGSNPAPATTPRVRGPTKPLPPPLFDGSVKIDLRRKEWWHLRHIKRTKQGQFIMPDGRIVGPKVWTNGKNTYPKRVDPAVPRKVPQWALVKNGIYVATGRKVGRRPFLPKQSRITICIDLEQRRRLPHYKHMLKISGGEFCRRAMAAYMKAVDKHLESMKASGAGP